MTPQPQGPYERSEFLSGLTRAQLGAEYVRRCKVGRGRHEVEREISRRLWDEIELAAAAGYWLSIPPSPAHLGYSTLAQIERLAQWRAEHSGVQLTL